MHRFPLAGWHFWPVALAVIFVGTVAVADSEVKIATIAGAEVAVTDCAPGQNVDWKALALGEFAVGGPAPLVLLFVPATNGATDDDQGFEVTQLFSDSEEQSAPQATAQPESPLPDLADEAQMDALSAAEAAKPSCWYCRQSSKNPSSRTCSGCEELKSRRVESPGAKTEAAADRPLELRAGEAAAEILKLRRVLGVNPIAGTIFDAPEPGVAPWPDDVPRNCPLGGLSGEQTMAEAIRRLEADEAAATDQPETLGDWPRPEVVAYSGLLRPAERKLEEAADMLEQIGQYERADAVRELARQVRQDARQAERQRYIWSGIER